MQTIRALIVDDEKPGRERLRRLLARDNRVRTGRDAAPAAPKRWTPSAPAPASGTPVQLMFLDVQMPELDGFGVLVRPRRAMRRPWRCRKSSSSRRTTSTRCARSTRTPSTICSSRSATSGSRRRSIARCGTSGPATPTAVMSQMQALLDGSGRNAAGIGAGSGRDTASARPDRRSRLGSRAAAARRANQLDRSRRHVRQAAHA